jgi:hypothetical protein
MTAPKKRNPGARKGVPRKIPAGFYIVHNHVQHTIDTAYGLNGFRYWLEPKPINYRKFMACKCGWSGLPHFAARWAGPQKCVTLYKFLRNGGMSVADARRHTASTRNIE